MIMCVLLCYPVSIRIYYQQGGLFLVPFVVADINAILSHFLGGATTGVLVCFLLQISSRMELSVDRPDGRPFLSVSTLVLRLERLCVLANINFLASSLKLRGFIGKCPFTESLYLSSLLVTGWSLMP